LAVEFDNMVTRLLTVANGFVLVLYIIVCCAAMAK